MKPGWLAGAFLALAAGCSDPMLENWTPPGGAGPANAPASRPARRSWLGRPKPPAEKAAAGDVYLLYLASGRAKPGAAPQGPYAQTLTLRNVEPEKAAWLMVWLTEPSGRGGSGERVFLVYTDSTILDWAARLVAMLDVPAGQNSDWARAVTSLLAAGGPQFSDRVAAERILKQLEPVYIGQVDTQHRWPACMLAGRLLDEILGRSREAAGRFEQAASISLPDTPGWLIARYAQARALRAAGDRAAAQTVATDIVEHAGANFQRTSAYRQAQKMVRAK